MASAIDKHVPPGNTITVSPCGQCQYTYNSPAGCYFLSSSTCTGSCGCAPSVNGPLARLVRFCLPQSTTSAGLILNCTQQAPEDVADDPEEATMIRAVADLFIQRQAEALESSKRWKLIAVVLGVLAAILAVALVVALMTR